MADILKYDVQTYVRELISKEFGSNNKEYKVPLDDRKLNEGEHRKGKNRSVWNCSINLNKEN